MRFLLSKQSALAFLLLVSAAFLFPEWASAQQGMPGSWCILRRHNVYEPPNCFEFLMCDTLKDVQRCGLAGSACGVGPLGLREGWQVDPNAHPQLTPGPYVTWQGGDYAMSVLGRFHGDWYSCLGQRKMELPQRVPVRDGATEPGFCILRKPIPQWPPNCFEFYLAVAGEGRAVVQAGVCFVTSLAARENWIVDPTMGGPYLQRGQAQGAHDRLHRFAGNLYGCPGDVPTPPVPPPNGGGGDPREWGNFSGGLEESVVQSKVQARRREGTTATFQSNPITLSISQGGRVTVTGNVVFEGSLRNDRTGLTDTRRATFTLYNGTCQQGSCSGKMTWFVEGFWPHQKPPGDYMREKTAEGTWNASRQSDGSWVMGLPNGFAPLWADIPYRLR